MDIKEYVIVHGWTKNRNGKLIKKFDFTDFKQAIAFVNRIAKSAEEKNHHPDIKIKYNKVSISLFTHDKNQLTDLDYDMARDITQMYYLFY